MKLSQLTAYAVKQYHITEEHKWENFKRFSVLCDPSTGKWAALLMRQWDEERGEMREFCDVKCGKEALAEFDAPYLSEPFRMHGDQWVGVKMDETTDESVVRQLLDRALDSKKRFGATIVLASELPQPQQNRYGETALPVRAAVRIPVQSSIPLKIQEMTALYKYGDGSMRQKSKNFYIQAKFMEDYEDDQPWYGEYAHYFTTYHDLRLPQLRGYFTWRTQLRRGNWQPVAVSLAYIYVYELLNGIGAASPVESLQKLKEFETAFVDSGIGDSGMKHNLRRWMAELAVVKNIDPAVAVTYFPEVETARDSALAVLYQPDRFTDSEVFEALCAVTNVRLQKSPVITKHGEGVRLFSQLWRHMCRKPPEQGNLFSMCFGEQKELRWFPLCNAVYWQPEPHADAEYVLNDVHRFICKDGVWVEQTFSRLYFVKELLNGFLHEADRLFRLYLNTGRQLKQRENVAWSSEKIGEFIRADRQAKLEAAKPKINIRFSQLEQIRRDASVTRDSLLTEEELAEAEEVQAAPEAVQELSSDLLDDTQLHIMRLLLKGENVRPFINDQRLMPSVVADAINEALFDEIGDTVLDCDGENLSLIEDYTDEIRELLGG